jgi:micrococcal nuclease
MLKKAIILGAIVFLPFAACQAADPPIVARVIDGDILLLSNGEKVRLIGVDTPESKDNAKLKRDPKKAGQDAETIIKMGEKAADLTRKLVEGKQVRLEYDAQKKDRYGRTLAYIYIFVCSRCDVLPNPEYYYKFDGPVEIFLNATLIKAGYARVMTVRPNVKHQDLFVKLQKEARKAERGLWKIPAEFKMSKAEAFALAEGAFKREGLKWQPEKFNMVKESLTDWFLEDTTSSSTADRMFVTVDKKKRTVKIDRMLF